MSQYQNQMIQEIIEELESTWDIDSGFFGKLRKGKFDKDLYNEFMQFLRRISFEEELVSSRAVSLLWYIPLFMEWQKERVIETIDIKEYKILKTAIENELERILGIP